MTTHTNLTTKSLIDDTHGLTFQADDVIITNGYYNADDGAGAKFNVVSGTATDGSYFEYTLTETLKAVMVIENGTVNIDQLGAKGDAVLPEAAAYNNAYRTSVFSANSSSTDNSDIINAAFAHSDVNTINFSENKIYGIKKRIGYTGDGVKKINGIKDSLECAATILETAHISTDLIRFSSSSPVIVKNIRLYKFMGTCAVGFIDSESVRMHNVTIKSLVEGIRFYDTSDKYCTAQLDNVHLHVKSVGIKCSKVTNSHFSNIYIYPSDSYILNGIYLYNNNTGNIFKKCFINGNTDGVSNGTGISLSVSNNVGNVFEQFFIDKISTVISVSCENNYFNNIHATHHQKAISFAIATETSFSNCVFTDTKDTDIYMYSLQAEKIYFTNCMFESKLNWIYAKPSVNESVHNSFFFTGCLFTVNDLASVSGAFAPSTVCLRESINASFTDCTFNLDSYPFSETDIGTNAALFYFTPFTDGKTAKWSFDGCRFNNNSKDSNGNNITLNSPIWVDSQGFDNSFVIVRNCAIKGFRWLIRVSTDNETSAEITDPDDSTANIIKINPAHDSFPTEEMISAAENLFTAKKRYLAIDNLYFFDTIPTGATTHYKKAEEYGLSE